MIKARIIWPDVAKGIAIILVVLNHTATGIINAGIAEWTPFWNAFHDICYAFMVPVFFYMSGWFTQLSTKPLHARVRSLFQNLVYPYLIWSLLQTGIMIVTKAGNRVPEWSDLPVILLDGWMQFWFLHCLILILVIDLAFRRLQCFPEIRLLIAVCLASAGVLGFQFPWKLEEVATHLIYFELGVYLTQFSRYSPRKITKITFFLAGMIALLTFHFADAGYRTGLRPLAAFSGIAACICVSALVGSGANPVIRFLRICGFYSLQIYVLHVIFAAGARFLMKKSGLHDFTIHFVVGIFAGLVLSLIAAIIDARYLKIGFRFPNLNLKRWRKT